VVDELVLVVDEVVLVVGGIVVVVVSGAQSKPKSSP
jgi:hypothetical protein